MGRDGEASEWWSAKSWSQAGVEAQDSCAKEEEDEMGLRFPGLWHLLYLEVVREGWKLGQQTWRK